MSTLLPSAPHPKLEPFISTHVFGVAEIHAAHTILTSIFPPPHDYVFLDYFALALATWAPINGHVCADISRVSSQVRAEMYSLDTVQAQDEFTDLKWPSHEELRKHLLASPLVHVDNDERVPTQFDYTKPLVLSGDLLYLTRQFIDEVHIAAAIGSRLQENPRALPDQAQQWITDVFTDDRSVLQADAVRNVLKYRTSVLLGGPGTGKTYTIAGMLHALLEKHTTENAPQSLRVALAAPTAKAAQQMTASITATLNAVDSHGNFLFPQQHRDAISSICQASSTIHRLLGWAPNNRSRFTHDSFTTLPYDVVILDEVSMISLPLMARLLEALPTDASLVLVGDPAQLQSVEAGAVLPQISLLASHSHFPIVTLDKNWRQMSAASDDTDAATPRKLNDIGELASRMRVSPNAAAEHGEKAVAEIEKMSAEVLAFLRAPSDDITFIEIPPSTDAARAHTPDPTSESVRTAIAPHLESYAVAAQCARDGDARGALEALSSIRVLCAHREGKYGIAQWNTLVAEMVNVSPHRGSVGQPLLNTRNDIKSGLVNGDTSIVVQFGASRRAAFPPRASHSDESENNSHIRLFVPSSLDEAEIAFAMTVHKAQGSQYDTVIVVVPPVGSPLLQRELLYTAITRARRHLVVVATPESITTAMKTSIRRASGLAKRIQQIPSNTPQA